MCLRTNSPGVSNQLVVVMINTTNDYRFPVIVTSNYWAADPLQRAWKLYLTGDDGSASYRLTLQENESGASLAGNRNFVLPPYSIATAVINTGIYTNAPPVFTSTASNTNLNPGQTLTLTNTASDANQPAQTLAFSLPVAPTNATLNSSNGILSWRPLIAQANSTNAFRLVVADNGSPSLSATHNFSVTVLPVAVPTFASGGMNNGWFGFSVSGATGPDYTVQASTNLLTSTNQFTTTPMALPFSWTDTNAAGFNRRFYRILLGS